MDYETEVAIGAVRDEFRELQAVAYTQSDDVQELKNKITQIYNLIFDEILPKLQELQDAAFEPVKPLSWEDMIKPKETT